MCQEFTGTLYKHAHSMRNSNQILHCDQTILEEKNLQSRRVDHATCSGQSFLTGMLTRDLFALTNLLVKILSLAKSSK